MEDEYYSEIFDEFDAFVEALSDLKEDGETVSVMNFPRLQAMRLSCEEIQRVLRESGCTAKVTCKQSELAPDVGSVSVEGKEIDIRSMERFCRAAEFADNTEVYPLVGDKVRLTFGFNNLTSRA